MLHRLHRLDRATLVLGVVALLSSLSAFTASGFGPYQINFVKVRAAVIAVLLLTGACAVVGAVLGRRVLALIASAGLLLAAAVQLLQARQPTNWLGGDASTVALLGGLGMGLLAVALADRQQTGETEREALRGSGRSS